MTGKKYQNGQAARLHTLFEADEEVEWDAWIGLYRHDGRAGGAILVEDDLGFVSIEKFDNDGELGMRWEELKSEHQPSDEEPDEEDYVIDHGARGGYGVTPLGRIFRSYDDVIVAIYDETEESDFRPNVWDLSDHGNFHLKADFHEEVMRILEERRGGSD